MRLIDADALRRKAQKEATTAWKMRLTAKVEMVVNQFIDWLDDAPTIEERKAGRWIPCSERLPDEYGEYLVTKRTIGWNCEEYNSIDIAYFDNDGFHKAYKVLAWMPLPEPYREDGEADD